MGSVKRLADLRHRAARQARAMAEAASHVQTVLLSLDQTDLGDRMALLMVAVGVGDRALPLAWRAEEGTANIGFAG